MWPGDLHPQSAVMEHHNKQVAGTERLFRFQAAHYHLGRSFDEFIYLGQLVQAEALRCAVEHWRRRKWKTAGSLFWQLNDCWPVGSWAVIDSALRPKAAYFFAKKFFAPVMVSMRRTDKGIEVWLTSDRETGVNVSLVLSLQTFDGQTLWSHMTTARHRPQASNRIALVNSSVYAESDPGSCYMLARVYEEKTLLTENRMFFVEPKHMVLPTPVIDSLLHEEKPGSYTLTLGADTLVRNIEVQVPGKEFFVDDNFFDLDAGEKRVIHLSAPATSDDLRGALKLRWLQ